MQYDTNIINYEVNRIRSGQPRPYADHEYVASVTISTPPDQAYASKWEPTESQLTEIARALVRWFPHGKPEWHQPRLKSIDKVGERTWRIQVNEPYID